MSTHFFLKMGIDLSEMSKLTYVFARGMVTQKSELNQMMSGWLRG